MLTMQPGGVLTICRPAVPQAPPPEEPPPDPPPPAVVPVGATEVVVVAVVPVDVVVVAVVVVTVVVGGGFGRVVVVPVVPPWGAPPKPWFAGGTVSVVGGGGGVGMPRPGTGDAPLSGEVGVVWPAGARKLVTFPPAARANSGSSEANLLGWTSRPPRASGAGRKPPRSPGCR